MKLPWFISKFLRIRDYRRYILELSSYVRGSATGKTSWGDSIRVPFPEFRSVITHGYIDAEGEIAITNYLEKTLTDRDVFFDIGANAGFYTLQAAHKGARVFSFEPFPSTRKMLEQNVKSNTYEKLVTVVPSAVSDTSRTLFMEEMERPGLNRISAKGTVPVGSVTLDEFGIVPTVMKVDVEKHELQVLRGAENLLRKHHPKIIVETNAETPEADDLLISLGYRRKWLSEITGDALYTYAQ